MTVNGVPIAEVPIEATRPAPAPPRLPSMGAPDPEMEHERALIGALILGWCSATAIDGEVRHPHHRAILDALVQVDLDGVDRLGSAIRSCRELGVDPMLCGRIVGGARCGYLAGCVRGAREAGRPERFSEYDEPPPPPIEPDPEAEEAELWDRSA